MHDDSEASALVVCSSPHSVELVLASTVTWVLGTELRKPSVPSKQLTHIAPSYQFKVS